VAAPPSTGSGGRRRQWVRETLTAPPLLIHQAAWAD
jgi:hypothetical protein